LVLEPAGRRKVRAYAHFGSGRWSADGEAVGTVREMLRGSVPRVTICAGNGAPCATSCTSALAGEICGTSAGIVPAQAAAAGLTDASALLHLILALSSQLPSGRALLLGTSGENGFAALLLDLP
jgi:hypothetical protein